MSSPTPAAPFRILHTYTVMVEKSTTEKVTREENGQRITTETPVVKQVSYTIILKEPGRRDKTELAFFKDVTYGEAVKKGLIPKVLMQQILGRSDANNALSEQEDKALNALNRRITDLGNEYMRLTSPTLSGAETEEIKVRRAEVVNEWMTLQNKAIDLNAAYQSVYASTAEHYTQAKMLSWLELFLTYVRDPEAAPDAPPRPMFPGTDFAARETAMGDMEDTKDPLFTAVLEKLPSLWMLYLFGRATTPEEFKTVEEEWAKEKALRAEAAAKAEEEAKAAKAATETAATPTPQPEATVAPATP